MIFVNKIVMIFVDKIEGFMFDASKAFERTQTDSLEDALKYFASLLLINSVLFSIVFAIILSTSYSVLRPFGGLADAEKLSVPAIGGIIFIMNIIGGIGGILIWGTIVHIFIYIFGGRKGLIQTIKAMIYGSTPLLVLGWIPLINCIAAIWSLKLEIIGIQQLQEVPAKKAILAVFLWILFLFGRQVVPIL